MVVKITRGGDLLFFLSCLDSSRQHLNFATDISGYFSFRCRRGMGE
jgi:hypothetical protein